MQQQNTNSPEPKKGNRSWTPPGSRLAIANPEPGYRYKWFSVAASHEGRIDEAREQGWEPVSGISGRSVKAGEGSIDTMKRVGTLRLMKMPEDLAESRSDYFRKQTDTQTMRPAQRAMQMLNETGGPYDPTHVLNEPVTRATRYPTARSRTFGLTNKQA